jgi:hypothetical protein
VNRARALVDHDKVLVNGSTMDRGPWIEGGVAFRNLARELYRARELVVASQRGIGWL